MSKLRIYGDTSGYVDFNVPAVAGTTTININKLLEADSSGNITLTGNLQHSGTFTLDVGGDITLDSDTGVGFVPRPRIRPVIVPENILPDEDIIQVTDLVGLKQTGYVNGKPYFGSVFVKDGQLFAGIFETIGELIPVYATLQESIDNQVTTRPSAIFRQGTDVTSNDPRLNIPGTPENLI